MLLVNSGCGPNINPSALGIIPAISRIKAFNITIAMDQGYSYIKDGLLFGWRLKNSIGVGREPVTGGIYRVRARTVSVRVMRAFSLVKSRKQGKLTWKYLALRHL
jgi:hypothetical protein